MCQAGHVRRGSHGDGGRAPEGHPQVLAESREAVDWPMGWLDGETPVFDRIYKRFDQRGHWIAGHSSAPEDLLPGILIGVLQPAGDF